MRKKRPFCVVRIVDDDAGVRDSYRFLVESEGWLVKTFTDAEDFIENNDEDRAISCVIAVMLKKL